jgi:protein-tyrosine phosphatase
MIRRFSLDVRRALAAALVLPFALSLALAGTPGAPTAADSFGPMENTGVKLSNFGIVAGRIYRGEQPGKDDYNALAALGVTTIIDLREDSKSVSRGYAEAAGLKYVNIKIDGHGQPSDGDVVEFLKVLDESPDAKVYVHCAGGRHRTGSMIAVYRMVREGWTLDRAYDEMLAYDFYTRNGHKGFKTFVEDYWQRMNANPASVPVAAVKAAN